MVCAYKDIPVRYSRLVRALDTKDGAGAAFYNICNLETLGIQVLYKRFSTLEVLYQLLLDDWPSIVAVQTLALPHWNQLDTSHAVVVMGMDSESVYVADPAFKEDVFATPIGEFDLAWLERDEQFAVLSR